MAPNDTCVDSMPLAAVMRLQSLGRLIRKLDQPPSDGLS